MTRKTDQKLYDSLFEEILRARTRVYRIGEPTPLEKLDINGGTHEIWVKREDLSAISAYKWRGAYNCTAMLRERDNCRAVVAASAGNHAQGVAIAARELGIKAKIFMPQPTPMMKRNAVQKHGGDSTEIILHGDTYNQAADAAKTYAKEHKLTFIHPFDDLYTIAGQATIADEVMLSGAGPFDYAFVQIGGGGMAAGVACWLKIHNPGIKIIGVEGEGQACMKAAFAAGKPVTLEQIDTFCDGTAVTRAGDLSYRICHEYIDEIITVSNEEVCAAIQRFWDARRVIPEPSGAMGLAGLIQYAENNARATRGKKMLTVLTGANMDFGKLTMIAARSAVGAHRRRYLRFHLREERGGLLSLLEKHFRDVNVSEFLYGKIHASEAWPIIAFEASPERMEKLDAELRAGKIDYEDVTLDADVRYRVINYNPALFSHPVLLHVHFPERRGALRDFMRAISGISNLCYFNYANTGEAIGRALMGFEFAGKADQKKFFKLIEGSAVTCRPVDDKAVERMLQG